MVKKISSYELFSVVIGALIIGAFAVKVVLGISSPPFYPDFIVGYITWEEDTKFQDILAVPAFIFSFFLFFIVTINTLNKYQQIKKPNLGEEFSGQILIWSLPFLAGFSSLFLGVGLNSELIYLPVAGIFFITTIFRLHATHEKIVRPKEIGILLLAVLIISLIPLEIYIILSRVSTSLSASINEKFIFISMLIAILGYFVALIYALYDPTQIKKLLPFLLLVGQLGLSLFYVTLYPAYILTPNLGLMKYNTTIWLNLLIMGLIFLAIIDVVRRYKKNSYSGNISKNISPFALYGLLIGLKFSNTSLPYISTDDYHFGEGLLGWWSYLQGAIPYVGYIPAHGFIDDDLPRAFSTIFYDGTASTFYESKRIANALLGLTAYISIFWFSGSSILAFIAIFLLGGGLKWYFLTLFLCLWFSKMLWKNHARWVAIWLLTAPIAILGVPPQGISIVIASALLAIYHLWYFLFKQDSRNWYPIAISSLILLIVVIITPIGWMMDGALKYVIENGAINQIAYGVPWALSLSQKNFILEIVRMSWIVVPPIALITLYYLRVSSVDIEKKLLPVLVLFIFMLFLIPYTLGRIDPASVSRPGILASYVWTILLPLIFWRFLAPKNKVLLMVVICFMGASIGFATLSFEQLSASLNRFVYSPPVKSGTASGLSNIGIAIVDDAHWERLTTLNNLLNNNLQEGDTYLDLTSRNAQYFYMNRIPPIPVTAPYNLVPISQQKTAVNFLRSKPPKIALFEGNNIRHDGSVLALRNPYLYQFVLDNYIPKYMDGFILGFRKEDFQHSSNVGITAKLKSITDENWEGGKHRYENAIVIDDPYLIKYVAVGDKFVWNGDVLFVSRVWPEGLAIWFEQKLPYQSPDLSTDKILWVGSKTAMTEYQRELLHSSFSQSDFKKIPISWGHSARSLESKMSKVSDLDSRLINSNDLLMIKPHVYQVNGVNPFLVYDLSRVDFSGRDGGLIKFNFTCYDKTTDPMLQIFWWGDEAKSPSEPYSVKFTGSNGILIVPLEALPRWSLIKKMNGLKVNLINSSACSGLEIKDVALFKRKFN